VAGLGGARGKARQLGGQAAGGAAAQGIVVELLALRCSEAATQRKARRGLVGALAVMVPAGGRTLREKFVGALSSTASLVPRRPGGSLAARR
jgi:hypothetical protein